MSKYQRNNNKPCSYLAVLTINISYKIWSNKRHDKYSHHECIISQCLSLSSIKEWAEINILHQLTNIKKQMQYGNNLNLGIFLIRVVCLKRILQHLKTQHSVNQGWKKANFYCRKLHSMINILWKSSSHFDFKPLKLHLWHVTTCAANSEDKILFQS